MISWRWLPLASLASLASLAMRRQDVTQGEDFENWRYDVALEAWGTTVEATVKW